MEHTKGEWKARPTSSHHTRLKDGTKFDQTTSITISTKAEARFLGKNIANIRINVPDEILTERDGSPDTLKILSNKCRYGLKEAEANARLIAAAPDLLDACEVALEFIGRSNKTDWDNEITPVLEQAIAKAKPKE